MLTMSLCMGLTVLGCAYGPTGTEPAPPARLAAAHQAEGRLVIQLAAPAGRRTLAFAEDLHRIEVTLRRHHGDAVETVGQKTLTPESGWKVEVFNLPPGSYDLQLIAYDRGNQAVQISAPAPYQVGPYEVRAYELATASVTLPLQPTHVVTFTYPTPEPSKKPNENKPNDNKGPKNGPKADTTTTAGSDTQTEAIATPTPTPAPTDAPLQPAENQPQEGGDS
jgi:hypothetical protein